MITTITVGGQSVNVVSLPDTPGFRSYELYMSDAVAVQRSPFSKATQRQQWMGADLWTGVMTPPGMDCNDAPAWKAFLGQMRGMANAVLLGDPLYNGPRGNPLGMPKIPGTVTDIAGGQTLSTVGWTPGKRGLLLAGDYLQVGYRLHMALDDINADSSGNAEIPIFPSLREVPTANAAIILANPKGLFGLSQNKRGWAADYTRISHLSIPIMEYV